MAKDKAQEQIIAIPFGAIVMRVSNKPVHAAEVVRIAFEQGCRHRRAGKGQPPTSSIMGLVCQRVLMQRDIRRRLSAVVCDAFMAGYHARSPRIMPRFVDVPTARPAALGTSTALLDQTTEAILSEPVVSQSALPEDFLLKEAIAIARDFAKNKIWSKSEA